MSTPTVPTVTMPDAEVKKVYDAALAEATKLGLSAPETYAKAQAREAKANYRRSNKPTESGRENWTFKYLDALAESLLRAAEQFDLPDDAENYIYDVTDMLTVISGSDSLYMAGTLRSKTDDLSVMPRKPRNRRASNGSNVSGKA